MTKTRRLVTIVVATLVLLVGGGAILVCRSCARLWGAIDLAPSPGPVTSRYSKTPLPRNIEPGELDAILRRDSASIFFPFVWIGEKIDVCCDDFVFPNSEVADYSVTWEKVLDKKGRNLLAPPPDKGAEKTRTVGTQEVPVTRSSGNTNEVTLHGACKLRVPIRFATLKLTSSQVGETATAGGVSVTLESCENDFFEIGIAGATEGPRPVIAAVDSTGGRLDNVASMMKREGSAVTFKSKVAGKVAEVILMVPVEHAERTFAVTARAAKAELESPATLSPRYVQCPELAFADLEPERVKSDVTVVSRRSYAMFGYNTPEIVVLLPCQGNSVYANVDFGKPQVLRGSEAVAHDTSNCGYDHRDWTRTLQIDSPQDGDDRSKSPLNFSRATGSITVNYPCKVRVTRLSRTSARKDGLVAEFKGCSVTVAGLDRANLPSDIDSTHALVRAYDHTGRQLKTLSETKTGGTYWGRVDSVVVHQPMNWVSFSVDCDLAPAPLLPKSSAGTRPPEYRR